MFEPVYNDGHKLYGGKFWEDLMLFEKWNYYRTRYDCKIGKHIVQWFFDKSIDQYDIQVLTLVLDYLDVPSNMTVKERICYYQLVWKVENAYG